VGDIKSKKERIILHMKYTRNQTRDGCSVESTDGGQRVELGITGLIILTYVLTYKNDLNPNIQGAIQRISASCISDWRLCLETKNI
jgi:hypothetical protein